ncbi:hypothetical protein Tcan_13528 [Toxocara canis]|uniref:Uncharacterized protein n=1 Tax=Toxocara canis TaxID=6265 RepID=A0A0B2VHG7_TOXCA|nr:hypothetical protein Tcan_13528 [Toxocara canis]
MRAAVESRVRPRSPVTKIWRLEQTARFCGAETRGNVAEMKTSCIRLLTLTPTGRASCTEQATTHVCADVNVE